MPLAGVGKHLQGSQLVGCLQVLLAELDDVHATTQRGIQELHQIALLLPRIRTQVEIGVRQLVTYCGVLSHKGQLVMCIPS
ncbi:hypothetical protein GCM10009789_69440 [Kribbella sancticallisti]|uniref:Uncharacterized protein n=1 Tax=Kribbella sancticallisti TaxID=460087 RepID=A0ABP4QD43_9ACTN